MNQAIKKRRGPQSENFLQFFGYMFEQWCRRVASECLNSSSEILQLSPSIGDHTEIEDIIVVGHHHLAAFSVKSNFTRAADLKESANRNDLISNLDNFFFGTGTHKGVVQQLHNNILKILSRPQFKEKIVHPVIVLPESHCDTLQSIS